MRKGIHKRDKAEILDEKITILEKENQCLKNDVKNQNAVRELQQDRTSNRTLARLMLSEVPSSVSLRNWFSNLMVTELSST